MLPRRQVFRGLQGVYGVLQQIADDPVAGKPAAEGVRHIVGDAEVEVCPLLSGLLPHVVHHGPHHNVCQGMIWFTSPASATRRFT